MFYVKHSDREHTRAKIGERKASRNEKTIRLTKTRRIVFSFLWKWEGVERRRRSRFSPYSPRAFFRADTRRRDTGIFSSTALSVSSRVPPDTDSISSTMDRFTR